MIEFRVYGTPVPQGSKKIVRGSRLIDDSPAALRRWRDTVTRYAAEQALPALDGPLDGPVRLTLTFYVARPKRHYRSGRFADMLRPDAPMYCSVKPDLDKLVRAVGDGLTDAGVWHDDAQVAALSTSKRYALDGRTEGVVVRVAPLPITE